MSTPKFADIRNLFAFLSKPTESEGFEQIIYFLNVNPIKYALTVNPTIYTSCIEQFWAAATARNINEEAQIHAKVNGMKVIISEATIRRDLKFKDEGGVDCLSNEVVFEQLLLIGVKRFEKKKRSRTHGLKRLYKIGLSTIVESSTKEQTLGEEDASKQGRNIADIDADAETTLVNETAEDQGRAEEKRKKPPTKAQKRNQMCVYLKNMAGFTYNQLKNKSFDEVQKAFDKTISWINSFVPMDSEMVKDKAVLIQESSSKRAGDELDQERSKKQKVEDDIESEELKRCLEVIPDDGDDVTINATPLSIKTPIIDYKIYKEGKMNMFEHHVEDTVWKSQQGLTKVKNWKLFDSCRVHCKSKQNTVYYLLVEKIYLLTNHTLHQMFNNVKLQVDEECEMAYELLRLVKKQLKEGYKEN
nr:hypothetical protein [Tanacetum cinerariifolium]